METMISIILIVLKGDTSILKARKLIFRKLIFRKFKLVKEERSMSREQDQRSLILMIAHLIKFMDHSLHIKPVKEVPFILIPSQVHQLSKQKNLHFQMFMLLLKEGFYIYSVEIQNVYRLYKKTHLRMLYHKEEAYSMVIIFFY